jgi:hypothetical protein
MIGFPVLASSGGYQRLDTLNGTAEVTMWNPTASVVNVVTGVTSAAAALTAEGSLQYSVIAVSPHVVRFRCNPNETWVKWAGSTVGTNRHSAIISW